MGCGDIDWRIRTNLPVVALGTADPITTNRQLGFIVSMGRGADRHQTIADRQVAPALAATDRLDARLLLTDLGEALAGERALSRLADRLPHCDPRQ
jgi:hypothetical protein